MTATPSLLMSSSEEKTTVSTAQQLIDALNTRNIPQILQHYHAAYLGEDLTGNKTRMGTEAVKQWLQNIFTAFPNLHYELQDETETGNRVVMHWTATGNHHGSFLKIPATGKHVSIHGMSMLTMRDGKISEGKLIWDLAGVLRQLGLLPQMP